MPLYRYLCSSCGSTLRKILSPEDSKNEFKCKQDGVIMTICPTLPSTIVKEVIDNGIMTKRVEQLADAPEYIQEREQAIRDLKNKKDL